jgi:predicted phage terminase large subunit-like protein
MKENKENISKILNNQKLRKTLAYKSHIWFFHIYLSHYVKFETAPFQRELFGITEDETIKKAVIVAFRGSAKSTIFSLSYAIWAVLGQQQKKFVVLLGQTHQQVKLMLNNIKREFETNELLRRDFGKLELEADEWRADSIVIPKLEARISAFSTGESIRGIRHLTSRPDLIVCDDVEDLQSVKTRDLRDKIYQWFRGDIIPAGDESTKIIIVGNLLHEDSLIIRLKESIEEGKFGGVFRSYPLINNEGDVLWPGRYPDPLAIEELKKSVGDEIAWSREYLLTIISDEGRVVHPEWIHYYDSLPDKNKERPRLIIIGFDPAISQESTADYSAAIMAYVYGFGENLNIYILPYILNRRLNFPQTIEEIKKLTTYAEFGMRPRIYVEDVSYQAVLVQQLIIVGLFAESVKVYGRDKRARLVLTTDYLRAGKILFPRYGAEILIQQLIGFGVEKYDDLVDAFTTMINKLIEDDKPRTPGIKLGESGGKTIVSISEINRILGHTADKDIMSKNF